MEIEFKYKNGDYVKDLVTGLSGVIDQQTIMYTGTIQYSVQPKAKEGEVVRPESWWFDEDQLEFIREEIPNKGSYKVDFKWIGGEKIKNLLTGQDGTVIRSILYLNGCIHYAAQPEMRGDLVPDAFYVNQKVAKELVRDEPIIEIEKRNRVGGPPEKSVR